MASSVVKLFVEAADGISQIVCDRGSSNEPVDHLLEVLTHELSRMDMMQFIKVFQLRCDRLLPVFEAERIDSNSQKFLQFLQTI